MADAEVLENEEEEIEEPAAGGGSRKLLFMLIALSLLVMVVTPLASIFAVRVMTNKGTPTLDEAPEFHEVALPSVQFNVAGTVAKRFAKLDIVVEVSDASMGALFQEQSDGNAKGKLRRITAEILQIASDKELSALLSSDAKVKLAEEIKTTLNGLLRDEAEGMVTDVYFSGFLVQ